jgi:hypothetical protein
MLAVILDIRCRTQDVGDVFLRARRQRLIDLELGDAGLTRAGGVPQRSVLVVEVHGGSFDR